MAFVDKLRSLFGWSGSRPPRVTAKDPELDQAFQPVNPIDQYHDMMEVRKQKRRDRYDVYDAMDRMPDVSTILDAYAEDCTQTDNGKKCTIWIEGDDQSTVNELTELFETCSVEDWSEGLARDLGKYGDDFARIIGDDKKGVTSLEWRDPRDIERIENRDGILLGFETELTIGNYMQNVQDDQNAVPLYKPWDFVHWRIYKQKRLPYEKFRHIYGTSLMWSSDRVAKQMKILDDLLMIVRLTRSLDRHIFKIDTGRSPVEEEIRIIKRWKRQLSRKTYIDPASGRFDSRFNPYSFTEDIYWPQKEGTTSSVDHLPGLGNVNDMVDVDHFRNKFFGSFRAPKEYFGYGESGPNKQSLSALSIRWARAVNSLQKAVRQGLTRLCQIHLAWRDMDTDARKFKVMMVAPSAIELLDRLEAWQTIVDVAERMATLGDVLQINKSRWTKYILENALWLSKQEIELLISQTDDQPDNDQSDTQPDAPQDHDTPADFDTGNGSNVASEKLQNLVDHAIRRVSSQGVIYGAHPSELPKRQPV